MNAPTLALPPMAALQRIGGGYWYATCLMCPGHTLPRHADVEAAADAHKHWQVSHTPREDRET